MTPKGGTMGNITATISVKVVLKALLESHTKIIRNFHCSKEVTLPFPPLSPTVRAEDLSLKANSTQQYVFFLGGEKRQLGLRGAISDLDSGVNILTVEPLEVFIPRDNVSVSDPDILTRFEQLARDEGWKVESLLKKTV